MKNINLILLSLLFISNSALASFEIIELENQVIEFAPSRDDITVGRVFVQFHCIRLATDEEYEDNGNREFEKCYDFSINEENLAYHMETIELEEVEKNEFELGEKIIKFLNTNEGHFCMAVKVLFNEVSHRYDSDYYVNRGDRYSLLSFCTVEDQPDWGFNGYKFDQNRVETIEEFSRKLSNSIEITLNEKPLPED